MRLHSTSRFRGLSLLELLLVLVVISVIVFTGISRYRVYQRERQLNIIRENVNLLFDGLNAYYRAVCLEGAQPPQTTVPLAEVDKVYPILAKLVPLPGLGLDKYVLTSNAPAYRNKADLVVYWLHVEVHFSDNRWPLSLVNWYGRTLGAMVNIDARTNKPYLLFSRLPTRLSAMGLGSVNAGAMLSGLRYFIDKNDQSRPGNSICGF